MNTNEEKSKLIVEYIICKPGGNDTALVHGMHYTPKEKKIINDAIMAKHPNVEQVGFIDLNQKPELQMAGGEFCGNATRSAANCYLNGEEGKIQIVVNETDVINAGVYSDGKSWCEIPLYYGDDVITLIEDGIYLVKMKGMVTLVINPEKSKTYLADKGALKKYGMELIHFYHLEENEAVGVMFCEYPNSMLKINPIVWVNAIDTLFYETACGSGTTATCMVQAFEKKSNQKIDVIQPSGLIITAEIGFEENNVKKAVISGNVVFDQRVHYVEIF